MPASKEPDNFDSQFYKPAETFFAAYSNLGLTYDDVTLATLYSEGSRATRSSTRRWRTGCN